MNKFKSHRILAMTLALSMLLTSCGGGGSAAAATMHLRKTQGTVGVSDGEGKNVEPREDLGLYSGYGVGTQTESYAWIDLDEVKLTKLDQDSEIAITQEGKKLEIEVKAGSLFFNVTEPLADDETMNIRTSTMLVGIRGTCGWVTEDTAALLEGSVEVTAGEQSAAVSAGEMAVLTGDGTLEVRPFSAAAVPAFVKAEIADDEDLAEEIKDASGIDLNASVDPIHLRDMYTYSKSMNYTKDGEWILTDEFFPDEQGRIGRMVLHDGTNGSESVIEYIYNEEGTLTQRVRTDGTVVGIVTENTADHRTIISPTHPENEYVYYYDEQGRTISAEYFRSGTLSDYYTYTYDAEGKLTRVDNYSADGTLSYYDLYEYD